MNLLENPTNYNLSESKFSLGVAIFDQNSFEFVDLDYFHALLFTITKTGGIFDSENFIDDFKPCNTANNDFDEINLNASVNKWKQGYMINSSMCFDMKKAILQSDYQILGKGYELNFGIVCHNTSHRNYPGCHEVL